MSRPFKICPVCDTPAHRNAQVCSVCGANISRIDSVVSQETPNAANENFEYDARYGETDLFEGDLRWRAGNYLFGAIMLVAIAACVAVTGIAGFRFFNSAMIVAGIADEQPTATRTPSATPTSEEAQSPTPELMLPLETNTPFPTPMMVTITPPPTATETPSPCIRQVQADDDLLSLAYSCGHRSLEIIDVVLELNELEDAALIQVGQEIVIPWPTPTFDPEAAPPEDETEDEEVGQADGESLDDIIRGAADNPDGEFVFQRLPTATLPPGVTWHTIESGENIISVAFNYGADVEILSQLNPEITFSQCDFGEPTGGPNCIVQLFEGQQVRVPAPTSTPTLIPTASGSETATPTPTATFNAPTLRSPGNRAFFERGDLITLRWIPSGTLAAGQVYRLTVQDLTADRTYTIDTQDIAYIVPEEWQSEDATRHDYEWFVSVINSDDPNDPLFVTETRTFTWQGLVDPTVEGTS